MSDRWRVSSYQQTADTVGDGVAVWTEYAVESNEGPICTGIHTRALADEIALLGDHTDCDCIAFLKDGGALPQHGKQPPSAENLIDRLGLTLEQMLAELRHIRAQAGERISSATVKTSTRGTDLEVHSYDDGRLISAVDDAIAQYARGLRELQRLQTQNWADTVTDLTDRVREGVGEA